MRREDITGHLDRFAASFALPIEERVTGSRIAPQDGGYVVETSRGVWTCAQVVIATGGYDAPITPPAAARPDPSIAQMHSKDYRRPSQLPPGATLVVGAGQSGVQLTEDLIRDGREVHLAVGPAPRSPRTYRGRDAIDWLYETGHYAMTIDRHPDPAAAVAKTNRYMSGCDGGKEIDLRRWHVDRPVQLYGSLADIDGAQISFSPDLSRNLDDADASYLGIRAQIDAYIARIGIDAPAAPPYVRVWSPEADPTTLDAAAAGITSVLWCIGFRPDYGWIEVDVFDDRGRPVYRRGERAAPGMHFIGLGWLGAWGSGRFLGIDQDAGYLAGRIEAQLSQAPRVAAAGAR